MLSNPRVIFLIWLFVLVYAPVLTIAGHFINFSEIYLYCVFLLNIKKIKTFDIAKIHVVALKKVIDFKFCSRKGCRWHGISDEDLRFIMLDDSQEW